MCRKCKSWAILCCPIVSVVNCSHWLCHQPKSEGLKAAGGGVCFVLFFLGERECFHSSFEETKMFKVFSSPPSLSKCQSFVLLISVLFINQNFIKF